MIIWTILLFLVALVWCTRHLDIQRAKREQIPLSSQTYPGPPEDAPFVSFLIAGKDEEANIERAVRSVLKQDYPNFELIVINDRSQDRTPAILERLKAEDTTGRLRVIHVSELREGWFGKNNAMREGVERARGSWLCFGDADCNHTSERSLSMAVRHAIENKADFFSLLPRLETHSLWERIIQPVAGALMVFWFHPQRVNDPNRPEAYANGAFMLMTRKCYEMIGGHEPVKTEVNEDMHMARQAKRVGVRLQVLQSAGLYRVRMYTGLKQIWRGWTRIFYGCFGTLPRLLASVIMLSIFSVSPYVALLASPLIGGSGVWLAAAAAFAIVSQQSILMRFYALTGNAPGWALTYPVGATVCLGMTLNAMTRLTGKTTNWRGTAYAGGAQVKTT